MFVQSRWAVLAGPNGDLPSLPIWEGSPCFREFVQEFSSELDVQRVLDEMKRGHTLVEAADGCSVIMHQRHFTAMNPTSILQVMANSANHILRNFDHNLAAAESERWLQRESRYNALTQEDRERFHAELRSRFENMKLELMKEFEPVEWRDNISPRTVGFGIYYFERDMGPQWLEQLSSRMGPLGTIKPQNGSTERHG
ncbi:MAG: hypothetical protein E2O56_01995 [Gammaproteobacteria bacterium]|nr:MAG: hypothetical protein E2O56_01995 [Gammaproteobacteria bacterium]